jgi:DNA-binding response OmpR family regulator
VGLSERLFPNRNRKQVLLISETREELKTLGLYLEQMGWGLQHASSQTEAMNCLFDGRINLIVVGQQVHGVAGRNVLKQLREDTEFSELPALLTAGERKKGETEVVYRNLPHAAVLSRPFSIGRITHAVNQSREAPQYH